MEVGNSDKTGAAGEPDIIVNKQSLFPPLPICVGRVVILHFFLSFLLHNFFNCRCDILIHPLYCLTSNTYTSTE